MNKDSILVTKVDESVDEFISNIPRTSSEEDTFVLQIVERFSRQHQTSAKLSNALLMISILLSALYVVILNQQELGVTIFGQKLSELPGGLFSTAMISILSYLFALFIALDYIVIDRKVWRICTGRWGVQGKLVYESFQSSMFVFSSMFEYKEPKGGKVVTGFVHGAFVLIFGITFLAILHTPIIVGIHYILHTNAPTGVFNLELFAVGILTVCSVIAVILLLLAPKPESDYQVE